MARLEDVVREGTRADQPLATEVPEGTTYSVTDESNLVERSTGLVWETWAGAGGGGSGTVTNSGTLTADMVILGNGTTVVKALAAGTAGQVLAMNGGATAAVWATVAGTGDVVGPAASVDKEIALFDGTTGKLLERATGTGYVKVTSGVMGTPVATVPISTDVSGLGTGVATFLATPSSANLAAAVTGETGSGALMFGTSPAITTDITIPNTGLHLLDTNASHDLIVAPGSDLSADRTLTITTGDADRTLTLTASSSIGGTAYVVGGTDVAIADGGTGQSTATAAFDALAPTTTAGDVIFHNGSDNVRLGIGTAGQALVVNAGATAPEWATPAGGGDVTASGTLTSGSIIVGGGTTVVAATTTGTGVVTALGVNVGSAGAVVVNGGALGTPSSGTLTNATGLPSIVVANEATDTSCFPAFFTAATGELGPKTNASLTYNSNTGALSIGTTAPLTVGTIELGAASDTTLSRASAGVLAIEGVNALTTATGQPLDATLTALAAYNTNGLITQTAADTFTGRTITGTANQITVSNGDGVAGNPTLSLPTAARTKAIGLTIDGGGSAITTGIKADMPIPFGCTITGVRLLADQSGSIVIDIWKDTYANYPPTVADTITASAKPTISTAVKSDDTTLTGWTTTITAGDTLRFNVDSVTTITRVNLTLTVTT